VVTFDIFGWLHAILVLVGNWQRLGQSKPASSGRLRSPPAASLERLALANRPGGVRRRIIFETEYGPAPRYIFLFYFQ